MPPILPPLPDCLHYLNAFCLYHSLQFSLQQHRPPLLIFSPRLDITGMNSNPKLKATPGALLLSSAVGTPGNAFLPALSRRIPCSCRGTELKRVKLLFFFQQNTRHWNSAHAPGLFATPFRGRVLPVDDVPIRDAERTKFGA